MNGLLGHTFIKADLNRNPEITFATNKMVGLQASTLNQFWNSAFDGLDASTNNLPLESSILARYPLDGVLMEVSKESDLVK